MSYDDASSAQRLDGQTQAIAGKAAEHLDYLAELLIEAKAGEIHQFLGFSSWTAYLADRLRPINRALDTEERRALATKPYEAAMSVRAVAETRRYVQVLMARKVSHGGTGDSASDGEQQTTGLDGKGYSRHHGGGGHRGSMPPLMVLKRLPTSIHKLAGLSEDDATLRDHICEQMDQLIASLTLQPVEPDVAVGNG